MKIIKKWIATLLVFLATGVVAQQATFDSGLLTLPAVKVGSATYINVKLQITDPNTYTFILTAATLQEQPPPPTSGNASACLDLNYLATGTKWVFSYRTLTNGTQSSTYDSEIQVEGPQSFNGQNAIEIKHQTSVLAGQAAGTTSLGWSYIQAQNLDVYDLGTKVSATITIPGFGTFNSDTVVTFNPAPFWRYSLNAGESLTTNWTATSTTTITGFPAGPQTATYPGSDTYQFLGFEDVTVPAGTFAGTCKWLHTLTETISGQTATTTSTLWNTRKGAMVKSVSGNDVTELTQGTVNGGPVGP